DHPVRRRQIDSGVVAADEDLGGLGAITAPVALRAGPNTVAVGCAAGDDCHINVDDMAVTAPAVVSLDALSVDTDWKSPNQWNGWNWNPALFPGPAALLAWAKSNNVHTNISIHCGVTNSAPNYAQ